MRCYRLAFETRLADDAGEKSAVANSQVRTPEQHLDVRD